MGGKYTGSKLKRFLNGSIVLQKFKLEKLCLPHLSCKGFFLAAQWDCSFTHGDSECPTGHIWSAVYAWAQGEIKLPLSAFSLSSWRNVLAAGLLGVVLQLRVAQKQLQPSSAQGPSIRPLTKSPDREGSLAYSVEYLVLIVFVSRRFSNYSKKQKPWVLFWRLL